MSDNVIDQQAEPSGLILPRHEKKPQKRPSYIKVSLINYGSINENLLIKKTVK